MNLDNYKIDYRERILNYKLPYEVAERVLKVSRAEKTAVYLILISSVWYSAYNCLDYENIHIEIPFLMSNKDNEGCQKCILKSKINREYTYQQYLGYLKSEISKLSKKQGDEAQLPENESDAPLKILVLLTNVKYEGLYIKKDSELTFSFTITDEKIKGIVKYNAAKIGKDNLRHMLIQMVEFLRIALENPEMKLKDIHALVERNPGGKEGGLGVVFDEEQGKENLVLMRKTSGSSDNIFFVHDGSGEVDTYMELINLIKGSFNFWGIRADRIIGNSTSNVSIEQIALKYIKQIQNLQPEGPYILFGWSIGGTIICEMCRRFEELGQTVKCVGFIDSPAPNKIYEKSEDGFNLETVKEEVALRIPDDTIKSKIKNASQLQGIYQLIIDYAKQSAENEDNVRKLLLQEFIDIVPLYARQNIADILFYSNFTDMLARARDSYEPKCNIKSPVFFFKAEKSHKLNEASWQNYCCSPIKFHTIEGDHFSIFSKPGVVQFADIVSELFVALEKNKANI